MTLEDQFLTKSKFSKLVEEIVITKRLTYMDAILHICDQHNIEPEDVRKFVSTIIKTKLEAEARQLNYLPRQNTLDSAMF
jgi:cell division ATPase FtsA